MWYFIEWCNTAKNRKYVKKKKKKFLRYLLPSITIDLMIRKKLRFSFRYEREEKSKCDPKRYCHVFFFPFFFQIHLLYYVYYNTVIIIHRSIMFAYKQIAFVIFFSRPEVNCDRNAVLSIIYSQKKRSTSHASGTP